MKMGSKGSEVSQIQQFLVDKGYHLSTVGDATL
jgi:hypothetical protein